MSAFVHLYYPHNLLPALAAVRDSGLAPRTFLLSPPGTRTPAHDRLLRSTVERLLATTKDARVVDALAADEPAPEAIFFAHDLVGDARLGEVFRAFPRSQRVAYGDSLGTVYSRRHFARLQGLPAPGVFRSRMRSILGRAFEAHAASLLVPVDAGGDFLRGKELRIPPIATAQQVARDLLAADPELSAYCEAVAAKAPHLLLLSNLAEAGLATAESELTLFLEVVARHVPAGAPILLKPHPGQDPARVASLAAALGPRAEIFDPRFLFVPIELGESLVRRSPVLSISYSTVSLRYLWGVRVIHALDAGLIERHILPEKRKWMSEGDRMYTSIVNALERWDGKSLLLAGAGAAA